MVLTAVAALVAAAVLAGAAWLFAVAEPAGALCAHTGVKGERTSNAAANWSQQVDEAVFFVIMQGFHAPLAARTVQLFREGPKEAQAAGSSSSACL